MILPHLKQLAEKDCGDTGCIGRDKTKPSGMRTNGGCRCRRDFTETFNHQTALALIKCVEVAVEALEGVAKGHTIIELEHSSTFQCDTVERILVTPETQAARHALTQIQALLAEVK